MRCVAYRHYSNAWNCHWMLCVLSKCLLLTASYHRPCEDWKWSRFPRSHLTSASRSQRSCPDRSRAALASSLSRGTKTDSRRMHKSRKSRHSSCPAPHSGSRRSSRSGPSKRTQQRRVSSRLSSSDGSGESEICTHSPLRSSTGCFRPALNTRYGQLLFKQTKFK